MLMDDCSQSAKNHRPCGISYTRSRTQLKLLNHCEFRIPKIKSIAIVRCGALLFFIYCWLWDSSLEPFLFGLFFFSDVEFINSLSFCLLSVCCWSFNFFLIFLSVFGLSLWYPLLFIQSITANDFHLWLFFSTYNNEKQEFLLRLLCHSFYIFLL